MKSKSNVELVGFARLETNIWAQKPQQPKVKHVCTHKAGGFNLEFCQVPKECKKERNTLVKQIFGASKASILAVTQIIAWLKAGVSSAHLIYVNFIISTYFMKYRLYTDMAPPRVVHST